VTISAASQLTVNESDTVVIFCSVTGKPTAQISWTNVYGSLPSDRAKVTSDGLMQIKDVRLEDAGKYRSMAKNLLGNDEKVASLIVQSRLLKYLLYHPLKLFLQETILYKHEIKQGVIYDFLYA